MEENGSEGHLSLFSNKKYISSVPCGPVEGTLLRRPSKRFAGEDAGTILHCVYFMIYHHRTCTL